MATGAKLAQSRRLAAALGFVSLVHRDQVTVHRFPFDRPAPRFTGRHGVPALFDHLASLEAGGAGRFADATTDLLGRSATPGISIVISDLLTPEWEAGIGRLPARGGDVVVVHVLAEEELRPSTAPVELAGDLDLVDVETGTRVPVSLNPRLLADYERAALEWADRVADRCRRAGAAYLRVLDTDDVPALLLGSWRDGGVLR